MFQTKRDIYEELSALLTYYEHPEEYEDYNNTDWEAELYEMLVRIQNRWEDTITVETTDEVNQNYRNLIEDLLEEKEALLKKLETKGAHALQLKALRSEIGRCKRVLDGKPYDRRHTK